MLLLINFHPAVVSHNSNTYASDVVSEKLFSPFYKKINFAYGNEKNFMMNKLAMRASLNVFGSFVVVGAYVLFSARTIYYPFHLDIESHA